MSALSLCTPAARDRVHISARVGAKPEHWVRPSLQQIHSFLLGYTSSVAECWTVAHWQEDKKMGEGKKNTSCAPSPPPCKDSSRAQHRKQLCLRVSCWCEQRSRAEEVSSVFAGAFLKGPLAVGGDASDWKTNHSPLPTTAQWLFLSSSTKLCTTGGPTVTRL